MDYIRPAGGLRVSVGDGDVVRDFRRAATGVRDRNFVRGARQTLSRCGQFVLVCRAGLPEQNPRVQVRARGQVRDRMVVASLLLDVSRRHGRHDGHHDRVHRRHARAEHDERGNSRPGIHGDNCDNFRVRCGLDRFPGSQRFHRRQYRDQRNPDRGAAVLRRARDRLPRRASRRLDRAWGWTPMATRSLRHWAPTASPATTRRTPAHSRSSCRTGSTG